MVFYEEMCQVRKQVSSIQLEHDSNLVEIMQYSVTTQSYTLTKNYWVNKETSYSQSSWMKQVAKPKTSLWYNKTVEWTRSIPAHSTQKKNYQKSAPMGTLRLSVGGGLLIIWGAWCKTEGRWKKIPSKGHPKKKVRSIYPTPARWLMVDP